MNSPKFHEQFFHPSYQKGGDYNTDIEGSTTHHGRRVRRCNWIRFLTVYEGAINKDVHSSRKANVHRNECNTNSTRLIQAQISPKRSMPSNGKLVNKIDNNNINNLHEKLKPNMLCCLTESGQVVYEVIDTLEPLTELVVQFKHRNIYMNNNNEDLDKRIPGIPHYPNEMLQSTKNDMVPFSTDITVFSPSRVVANMLLIDAIAGLIGGKYT